jgi:glutamate-1-semialdehyde 2,1-aminomutase
LTQGETDIVNSIEAKFRKRTPRSAEFAARAVRVMPGGETRNAVYHRPYSVVIDHASGTRLYDVDGNEYVDLNNNHTVLVHGHAYGPVVEAATRAVRNSATFNAKTPAQIELAELLVERVSSLDEVKFANSGSEGVLAALEIARGYNGRSKVLVSTFSFHGHSLDTRKPGYFSTHVGEWGDAESFERILEEHGDEIAICLLEPWLGAGGLVGAPTEFFTRVHAACRKADVVFCLDEASVFRLSTGGAQGLLGVEPDLTVLGKHVGGGFPCGGVGGRRELMELANPYGGSVVVSGTFSGNPVSMAAGLVSMRELTEDRIDRMAVYTEQVDAALAKSAANHGIPYASRRVGSLVNLGFSESLPVANHVREDRALLDLFHHACIANGIFAHPPSLMNLTSITTDDDVTEITQRLDQALADMADALPSS